MPYILFNTHHWQRAASQETHEAASLHNISGYICNHSSVSEGQHATRLFHVDHKVTFAMQCEQNSYVHTMSLPFSRRQHADSLLHEMDINHLLSTSDFKASRFWSPSMHFLRLYSFEKTQWTEWILSLCEQAAAASTWLFTILQLFLFHVPLLFPFSCPSHQSENIQWPSNTPVHAY